MKRISAIVCILLLLTASASAQSPVYSFNVTATMATEGNVLTLLGYVKADVAPTTSDSVLIVLKSGSARPTQMDTSSQFTIRFAAGDDSVPFLIQLHDDTFPEYTEYLTYVLRTDSSAAGIGADSLLDFTLVDNDLPATISFVIDTGSAYLDDGSFSVCVTINNPNPFYVRFREFTYDGFTDSNFYHTTAFGGFNYFYDRDTVYAPPGTSTICQNITIVPNNSLNPDQTLVVVLFNIDANNITDSLFFFTIKNDNFYYPPTVSFDQNGLIVYRDTSSFVVGIPLTTVNPNHRAFTFTIDTFQFNSTSAFENVASYHFNYPNGTISHPGGTWHDTLLVNILDDHLIFDTSYAVIKINGVALNTSPDTFFHLTIIDTGSLVVSFKGAGFAHLKDDSIGYVQVYLNSPSPYPVSVDVSYLNGDAVAGVDFIWRDTTIVFPTNMFDTISLPVIMLKDHLHDGNKQVNLQLTNVNPASSVAYDIRQYTFIIIDDDSTASYVAGISDVGGNSPIKVYPNPFVSDLTIENSMYDGRVSITNLLGDIILDSSLTIDAHSLHLSYLPNGFYILKISTADRIYSQILIKE